MVIGAWGLMVTDNYPSPTQLNHTLKPNQQEAKKPPNPKAGGYCDSFNIKCYSIRLLLVLIVRYV